MLTWPVSIPNGLERLGKTAAFRKTRCRQGKWKKDTRHSSRDLQRVLVKSAILRDTYKASVPVWDERANRQRSQPISFLPIHETFDSIVDVGEEEAWATCDEPGQTSFRADLGDWAARACIDVQVGIWMMLALWGDSAPYSKKDSVVLLTYRVLSGSCKRRL